MLNVFPVAWATQRSSMTGGPGEVHATPAAEAEPRGAVRLVPPAGLLRHDHAPAHARVRHDRGAVRRDRGRVPASRQPESRRGDAREDDDARRLPGVARPRRPAPPVRLVPDLRRRRGVRHDVDRARPRPPAPAGRRRAASAEGISDSGQPLEPAARDFTSTPQVFSAPPAFAMARLAPADVDVLTVYDPFTVVSLMQIEDMGFCPKGDAGALRRGRRARVRRGEAAVQHPRRPALARVRARHRARRRGREAAAGDRGRAGAGLRGRASTAATPARTRARSSSRRTGDRGDQAGRLPAARSRPTRSPPEFFAGAARGELVHPALRRVRPVGVVPGGRVSRVAAARSRGPATSGRGRLFSWAVVRAAVPPRVRRDGPVRDRARRARGGTRPCAS